MTTTILDLWNSWLGWDGKRAATIDDAFTTFRTLTLKEKDQFCGRIIDNMRRITDIANGQRFMNDRLGRVQ